VAVVPFDRSVLKVNQAILMGVIVVGYLIGLAYQPIAWVLPVLAVMMLAGVGSPSLNVPRLLYLRWLKPARIVKPRVVHEDPAPHRFAQLVGGVFLAAASVFVITGLLLVAWVLAWIVAALAFLNFAFNICVGCIMYAQLVRIGLLPLARDPAR
jgi:hypothetical protein